MCIAIQNAFKTLVLVVLSIAGLDNLPSLVYFCLNVSNFHVFDFVKNRYTLKGF